jgi:hypothetical protein
MIEGNAFPFFGFTYSPEKVLFNFDELAEDQIDFSRNSIKHAQYLVNFFVDESRLSKNKFLKKSNEYSSLIDHLDPEIMKRERIDEAGQWVSDELLVYTFE